MISVKFYKEIFSYLKGSNRKMEKLAYEEPHNLYASSDIIRVIKPGILMGGACSTHKRCEMHP